MMDQQESPYLDPHAPAPVKVPFAIMIVITLSVIAGLASLVVSITNSQADALARQEAVLTNQKIVRNIEGLAEEGHQEHQCILTLIVDVVNLAPEDRSQIVNPCPVRKKAE